MIGDTSIVKVEDSTLVNGRADEAINQHIEKEVSL